MSKSTKSSATKSDVTKSDALKYDKKTPREHVLIRPDTYIGDTEPTTESMWIVKLLETSKSTENTSSESQDNKSLISSKSGKSSKTKSEPTLEIVKETITYTPGLLKIFDEVIVNARDASISDETCDTIKVEYNKEEGYISVWNNGDIGIPVEEHPEHKVLVPSMIFGELLTSSNYNDDEKRITGGRNGYGSKVSNIFSTKFIVDIIDVKRKKKFSQTWRDNMSIAEDPIITNLTGKNKSSVKITFYPDFARFKIKDLDNDHYNLFHRRTIDIAGVTNGKLKMYFNDVKIETNTFKSYVELYYPNSEIFFDYNDRWSVGCLYKPDNGSVISFVNGISTYREGTHCNHVVDKVIKILIDDYIKKKDKDIKITPMLLKNNFIFFINAIIENPAFSSQTKDTLTTKPENFGSKYEPSPGFLKKLSKCGIVEQMIQLAKFKENTNLKKTDGKKQVKLTGIPKLEDANKAGTRDSNKCTLILTEGDSAKAFAMAGLGVIGRDYFGVFPLKGKLLNVREATTKQLSDNDEINNLKQIIGLKQGVDYLNVDNFNQLRYGRIVCLTDSDVDGSHIKGLLMNFFHCMWPSLLQHKHFITSMATPIVKATKGTNVLTFYNLTDYENWKETPESKNYKTKYYKGLGTSSSEEAREYFIDVEDKLINYYWQSIENKNKNKIVDSNDSNDSDDEDMDDDAIKLAFDKTRADDRKDWLMSYDKDEILQYENKHVSYYEFVHLELKHFSNDDNSRSIPSLIDGFKPSQRKILYGAFLRGLDKTEVKVAQLAGFVSDRAAYHHGEASLMGAIIGMAQNFVGSNNINLLYPAGQFGTRLEGGKDAASPRYIWTGFHDTLTPKIFMEVDEPIFKKQDDDGTPIEPETYAPIIPMILVNGAKGIGTGFSTTIPPFNPKDIIQNIRNKLTDNDYNHMIPWYQGFEGRVEEIDAYNYELHGLYHINNNELTITELPVGEWTSNYKEFLEKMLEVEETKKDDKKKDKKENKEKKEKKEKKKNPFLGYTNKSTDTKVHFVLEFEPGYLEKTKDIAKIYKLIKKVSIGNMHLYNKHGAIQKYSTIEEILDEYYDIRLDFYQKRKDYLLETLKNQLMLISYKVKFILMIVNKEMKVNNKKKSEIEAQLISNEFPKHEDSYSYLLSMPIYNLTQEKIEELKKQEKNKQTEYNNLIKKTINELWLDDLNDLENQYDMILEENKKKVSKEIKVKPTKGKKK
jgi:DNA topoisomerase-2